MRVLKFLDGTGKSLLRITASGTHDAIKMKLLSRITCKHVILARLSSNVGEVEERGRERRGEGDVVPPRESRQRPWPDFEKRRI